MTLLPERALASTQERRGGNRRAALLAAARRLFAERGFHGASVGDIADAAGLRKPSLFHHFATKEALYREVIAELYAELSAAVAGPVAARRSYAARLDAVSEALVECFAAKPEAARLLLREALDPCGPIARDSAGRARDILAGAEAFLSEGMAAGEFAIQPARQLLLSLTGLHVTYFALAPLVAPMLGAALHDRAMVDARKAAVLGHVRAMVLAPPSPRP